MTRCTPTRSTSRPAGMATHSDRKGKAATAMPMKASPAPRSSRRRGTKGRRPCAAVQYSSVDTDTSAQRLRRACNQPTAPEHSEAVGWLQAQRLRRALVSVSTLLYWTAAHGLRPFVTLRLDDLGAGDAFIGLAVAAFPFLSLFVAIPAGRLVDRVGVQRVMLGSYTGMVAVGIGYAMATSPVHLLVLQALDGVAELGVWLALQALISEAGSAGFLSRQLALFSVAWGLGIAIGPALGAAVYDTAGFSALAWIYDVLSAAAWVAASTAPATTTAEERARAKPSLLAGTRLIAARPVVQGVLLSSFVALFANAIRGSFYPLYLQRSGVSVARIGVLLSIMGVASLLVRVALPSLLARWRAGSVLVTGMWVEVLGMAATPMLGTFWLLAVVAGLFGAGHGVNPAITVELMARHTDPPERGLAMGVRVTANRLAQTVQPALFGALGATVGIAAAFPASGALLAGLTVWAARQFSRAPDPSAR